MLAGFSNNPLLINGVSNPGLSGWCLRGMAVDGCWFMLQSVSFRSWQPQWYSCVESPMEFSIFFVGFFVLVGVCRLSGTANSGLIVDAVSLITGSNSDFPDLQKNMPVASESLALSGLAGMGLPTSPVSISSTIVNSMVNQQGNSPLSRLEPQVSCSLFCARLL